MVERSLTLLTINDGAEPIHAFTVEPPLRGDEIASLKGNRPFESRTAVSMFFDKETGALGGWPYDHIVSETEQHTVLAVPDSIFGFIREQTPEQIARKLARTLHARYER